MKGNNILQMVPVEIGMPRMAFPGLRLPPALAARPTLNADLAAAFLPPDIFGHDPDGGAVTRYYNNLRHLTARHSGNGLANRLDATVAAVLLGRVHNCLTGSTTRPVPSIIPLDGSPPRTVRPELVGSCGVAKVARSLTYLDAMMSARVRARHGAAAAQTAEAAAGSIGMRVGNWPSLLLASAAGNVPWLASSAHPGRQ